MSLSDISNISVLVLPIYPGDITNPQHYYSDVPELHQTGKSLGIPATVYQELQGVSRPLSRGVPVHNLVVIGGAGAEKSRFTLHVSFFISGYFVFGLGSTIFSRFSASTDSPV